MPSAIENNYLDSVRKQFEYYKLLGDRTFFQMNTEELFWQYNEESNSIAIIVNHLAGNMKSRWTNFLSSDGEKESRNRDLEFKSVLKTKKELETHWEEGWQCLFTALDLITPENIKTTVYIRNQGHTVVEAINRQLSHYVYHIGQIVFVGKMLKAEKWQSLSIPKGHSISYNAEKFAKEKYLAHFTDAFLSNDDQPERS